MFVIWYLDFVKIWNRINLEFKKLVLYFLMVFLMMILLYGFFFKRIGVKKLVFFNFKLIFL